MITLKKVTINKYKSIETEQSFDVEPDVTVLVGKNEAGKTAILEAMHKSNSYLNERLDSNFDFPKKEKKRFDRSKTDVTVIKCTYSLTDELMDSIQDDIGVGTLTSAEAVYSTSYHNTEGKFDVLNIDIVKFFDHKFQKHDIRDNRFKSKVLGARSVSDIEALSGRSKAGKMEAFLEDVRDYLPTGDNINASLSRYVIDEWIRQHLPKFLYYDEYYELPSEVSIRDIQNRTSDDKMLETARALFELADINIEQLDNESNYEAYKSELEATAVDITLRLFEYWKTNSNLRVEFDIDRKSDDYSNAILKIRLFNNKYMMSLPLGSRSRGFNWFFSFLVWFSKIQVEQDSTYILLLDEPGLNLHASAQADLLRFIEYLAEEYQVVYTTHSPFMIESDKLIRVRTIFEADHGTHISDVANEKDPDTLFPLQAALGYDIVQHLFVSKNNLLVEGVSDLTYLTVMSAILESKSRTGLRDDIAIVPIGGADKVATFVALIRGQELNIACLLDTVTEYPKKQKVDDLIDYRIIHQKNVRYFHEFTDNGANEADIEDMFEREEFVALYNEALHHNLKVDDLDKSIDRIVEQIRNVYKKFNAHYQVSKTFAARAENEGFLSEATLDRFDKMYKEINKRFED
ncbi:MAG: AAA family ATPase [Chloroflexi bacterium]|nr:AAA family ATPase [Chloroflexota bacterium]